MSLAVAGGMLALAAVPATPALATPPEQIDPSVPRYNLEGRRVAIKQALLRQLYGDRAIDEMKAIKRALDPDWKLSPGVLFPVER